MSLLAKLLITGSFLFLYKVVNNLWHWWALASYHKMYQKYCFISIKMNSEEKHETSPSNKDGKVLKKIQESQSRIIELFKKAGLESFSVTIVKPAGLGKLTPARIDIFENLDRTLIVGDTNIPLIILKTFTRGIGVYKKRVKEALNPLYWLDFLIFLPKNLISYFGFPLENKSISLIAKTLNIVWGVICFITFYFPQFFNTLPYLTKSFH